MQDKAQKKESPKKNEQDLVQLQLAEQGLQNLLLQKQVFQLELIEAENALEALKDSKEQDVFKIVGNLMIKSNKSEVEKDLARKKDVLELRIKTIEKQENDVKSKLLKAREGFLKTLKKG